MENRIDIDVVSPPSRWNTLLRQNSEKIGALAEQVALPKNQRSGEQSHLPEVILLRDVEAQDSLMSTVVIERPPRKQTQKFPIFIVIISIVQVVLMYKVNYEILFYGFAYDPHRRHELWRFVTKMLVHENKNGYFHLWSNVIMQLIIGIPLEIVHHFKRVAIIYLSSVVGGSLFISVLSPRTYAVGASAAVYGLLFSHFSTLVLNWNEMDRKFCRLFWLLAFVLFDIYSSIYVELEGGEDGPNISHADHLGGAITGFLVSILVLKNFKSHPWEEKMQKICFKILIVLAVTMVLINIFAWGLYKPTEWNLNYKKSFDMYLTRIIVESPEDSKLHKLCEEIPECKLILDQYKFNATISNVPLPLSHYVKGK